MKPIRAKPHRLPRERYRGYVSTSFTACIEPRKPFFTTSRRVDPFVASLEGVLFDRQCDAVYTFMPDHLHMIISGKTLSSDTLLAMETFKQQTGWWLKQNEPRFWWEHSFHDRIMRNTEEYATRIRYVLSNPVRANMVEEWEDYPFTGAIGLDLKILLCELQPY